MMENSPQATRAPPALKPPNESTPARRQNCQADHGGSQLHEDPGYVTGSGSEYQKAIRIATYPEANRLDGKHLCVSNFRHLPFA